MACFGYHLSCFSAAAAVESGWREQFCCPCEKERKKKHLKDKGVNIRSFRDDRARNQMARGGEPENADVEDERELPAFLDDWEICGPGAKWY
ncbi:hypothetical protein RRG08_020498 [Elysia crispata]|uniref:Uncharacterized protein n=1 Tax=Elysia crispata TaxID=231223 RepID=A0AAE1DGK2_9GAST|nr:hypothetical protein RRG08_020498 [Elysia crispata]